MSNYNDGYNDYHCWPPESTSNTDEDELSSPEIEEDDSDDDTQSSSSSTSTSATSSSDSSQSTSDSENTSTAEEDEAVSLKTEPALVNKTELNLPAGMCDDEEVFKQLLSVNSWVCLSDQQKQHLKNFLPTFPENDLMEKEITLRMLFGGQSFRFGVNPIDEFHDKLKNGHFRPDIVRMKSLLRRSLKREYRKHQRIYSFNMLKKLLPGCKKVIEDLNGSSSIPMTNIGGSNSFTMHQQVRRRYFRELSYIKNLVGDDSEDSSDSNYQEGPPARLSKKQRRHLSVVQNSLSPEVETITSTLATYEDGIDLSRVALPMSNPFDPTEDMYREMLISHKRKLKKIEQEQEQMRCNFMKEPSKKIVSMGSEKKRSAVSDRPRVKRTKPVKQPTQTVHAPVQLDVKPLVKLEEVHNTPIKLESAQPEPSYIPYIKEEILQDVPSPSLSLPPSPPPPPPPPPSLPLLPPPILPPLPPPLKSPPKPAISSPPSSQLVPSIPPPPSPPLSPPPLVDTKVPLQELLEKESINAIKIESCDFPDSLIKIKEERASPIENLKVEPVSLTADEIRKAEEGQAAAAMLLEQMSDIEEKYNPPLTPIPPLPPSPSPPPLQLQPQPENIDKSELNSPNYIIKREFHPEDMLTSTVQSISTESPKVLNTSVCGLTPNDYNYKQLSLSPISTPSKIVSRSSYVGGSLSELEGFHILDIKTEYEEDLDIKQFPVTKKITASFFALIRDIICSTWEYRMNMTTLTERVQDWVNSTLNNIKNPDWYHSLALKTWPKALHSAIGFLAGHFPEWQPEDFVPFIEYKPNLDTYQWIGAGRDSDARLGELCQCWLHNLNNINSKLKNVKEEVIGCINSPVLSSTDNVIIKIEKPETDASISLPSPLLDTWIVTPSNAEERAVFQAQEKQRFLKPHRSFIYRMHGYESVVGPVRGIYNSSNIHKAARGHSLLIENRLHFISILVLVRDATARLPNGMGTRSDICTLLKDSQYLMEANQTDLHNAVSGALDRLHYEHDPCVKYDPKRKIWIYLHRGRTMEEFERLHLEQQGAVKTKCWRRTKTQKTEPKRTVNKKLNSNVLLESLSMLDLPTSSTSDSMPSSSTSPGLSDLHLRFSQDVSCLENLKQPTKTPRNNKNRKVSVQTTDNAVELSLECPKITVDQTNTDISQLFTMPDSDDISTFTTNNSSTTTSSIFNNQPMISNISSQSIFSSFTGQPIVSNVSSSHKIGNDMLSKSISNINTSQSIAISITNQSTASNIISQSMANSNIKLGSTQMTVTSSGQMVNVSQNMSSNNQTLGINNKMKQVISSGDLITIGHRKKTTKNVQIAQSVSIGSSSGSSNLQQDNNLTINKMPQNKEVQRQIFMVKQNRSDHSTSSSESTANIISQTVDTNKPQFYQLQSQQKLQKQLQMQLKLLQHKQIIQQTLQQNKQQVLIRKSDGDDKTESTDGGEHSQVIFVKQGLRGVQSEAQQITQQQLQQLLMMRPQQQTGQQAQVVMVKQPGNDQKPIALKPILTSLCGTKLQQNPSKSTNLLLQAKQASQNLQHRITKPIVGQIVSNSRTQLSNDTVLANRKLPGVSQGTSLRISGVQTSKSGQPQYTVVTVAQPKLMPSNQLNIGQQTPTRLSAINDRLKTSDSNQPQTLRVVQSQIGGKPVLVTNKAQISTTHSGMSTSSSIASSSVVNSTANTYTVLQQGSQQILVPASSLKSIQGLKVIPLSQHSVKGRSQMFARLVNSDGVRPVFIQQPSNQDSGQESSESNT